ncbi:MAG: PrsW family intramembrane metalloprotease [Erysipelotrichaceae bacterium]|nr:PrsW family intramembrane metalloprotease [Erysipelotrichaceae bacterium]
MGFIGLPVSIFLYWLMPRPKKEAPFPKGGLLRLVIAGAVSVLLSTLISVPVSMLIALLRTGTSLNLREVFLLAQSDPAAAKEMIQSISGGPWSKAIWSVINMFFSAGLLEEGLKYLTCRKAIKKEGMILTWMDCVIAFAIIGISFEMLENIFSVLMVNY